MEDFNTKRWKRTTYANYNIPSNTQRRTRFLPPLPGVQSEWKRVGRAAEYQIRDRTIKGPYRYIIEQQMYNNGYSYRLIGASGEGVINEIKPIKLSWQEQPIKNHAIIRNADRYNPRFYTVILDMHSSFDEYSQPENIFGDTPMSDTKYRRSNISWTSRKQ